MCCQMSDTLILISKILCNSCYCTCCTCNNNINAINITCTLFSAWYLSNQDTLFGVRSYKISAETSLFCSVRLLFYITSNKKIALKLIRCRNAIKINHAVAGYCACVSASCTCVSDNYIILLYYSPHLSSKKRAHLLMILLKL